MPRLSITLTESQNAALERIAHETGATKQSMIGLAVSAWIRDNDVSPTPAPKTPEKRSGGPEWYIHIQSESGHEVLWLRGRWETPEHKAVIASGMSSDPNVKPSPVGGAFRYELEEGETYFQEDLYPEDMENVSWSYYD